MALLIAAPLVLPHLGGRSVGGLAVASLGVLYLSDSLYWFVSTIARPALDPVTYLHMTQSQVSAAGLQLSQSGLIGGWLATGAAIGIVMCGALMAISGTQASLRTSPTEN